MTFQKSNDSLALDRLAAFMVDEILNMTDEEIRAEVMADGEDLRIVGKALQFSNPEEERTGQDI